MDTKQKLSRCWETIFHSISDKPQADQKMSEPLDTLGTALKDLECSEDTQERFVAMEGKDERTCKIIRNIRDLDASIREMELQLKAVRAESLDLQLKNCEELKNKLATEPLESESLAKNTRRFLELCAVEENNEKLLDESRATHEKHARSTKLKLQEIDKSQESMSITDEEKRRLDFLARDASDSKSETNFDRNNSIDDHPTINPYSIDESSKVLLKELEDKLKMNTNNKLSTV